MTSGYTYDAVEEGFTGNADSKEPSQPPGAPEDEKCQIVISLGQIADVLFCVSTIDRYIRANKSQGKDTKPEYRLIPMIAGGILTPLGLFIYGWTAEKRVRWMVPIIRTSLFSFCVSVCQIVSASYLVDAYSVHAASAVAATMILRYMASASLPLAGPPMYNTLGLGWGKSVLGFVALINHGTRTTLIVNIR